MYILDQDYKPIENIDEKAKIDYHFWVFDRREIKGEYVDDFYLKCCNFWFTMKADAYRLQVGKDEVVLPANYFMLIADISGGLDAIKPDEIVGRDFDVLMFNRTLDEGSWTLEPVKVIGFEEDYSYVYPEINSPFPVLVGENSAIMISQSDMYKKVKDLAFADII